jgi:hypothetical protein
VSLYKFEQNDVFKNRIKTHPRISFVISDKKTYYNRDILPINTFAVADETIQQTKQGDLSLYELNINRDASTHSPPTQKSLIYPFITKQGSLTSFKTISTEAFQAYSYGDEIRGVYPLSSSIDVEYQAASSADRPHIKALKNTFNYYRPLSPYYAYESSNAVGTWDKLTQEIKLVSIPSIFYGSSIKKGSVDMKFYITGSLVGRLQDSNQNGELIQTLPNDANVNKVAGTVLYNEGFVALTGSWDLSSTYTDEYLFSGVNIAPKWTLWGQKFLAADPAAAEFCPSSSWTIDCEGTNYVPVITMLAHAKMGDLNHSNNPTYVKPSADQDVEVCVDVEHDVDYYENDKRELANVVKSPYLNTSGSFEKTTYISKVGIYDENKNLIAIAKLATPVKKTISREYTFKMKIDF